MNPGSNQVFGLSKLIVLNTIYKHFPNPLETEFSLCSLKVLLSNLFIHVNILKVFTAWHVFTNLLFKYCRDLCVVKIRGSQFEQRQLDFQENLSHHTAVLSFLELLFFWTFFSGLVDFMSQLPLKGP